VFEDRLGLYVINPANLASRLPGIRAFGIKDVFLPRSAAPSDLALVRAAGLYAHMWVAVDGLSARDYANRTLFDIQRLGPGAVELNIELSADPPLKDYIAEAVSLIRSRRLRLRMRINVAPWKGFALPVGALTSDSNLYACEQTYAGDMSRYSEADAYANMIGWGVPPTKATVCYGAAGPVPGSSGRVCTLPDLSRWNRGVIFQDDLMAEVGLL